LGDALAAEPVKRNGLCEPPGAFTAASWSFPIKNKSCDSHHRIMILTLIDLLIPYSISILPPLHAEEYARTSDHWVSVPLERPESREIQIDANFDDW
jgi:hypothetical protein